MPALKGLKILIIIIIKKEKKCWHASFHNMSDKHTEESKERVIKTHPSSCGPIMP